MSKPFRAKTPMLACLVALSAGGCSLSSFFDTTPTPVATEAELEPNYKQLVADNLEKFLAEKAAAGRSEISPLRRSLGPQPGAWMACVRSPVSGQYAFFGVFIENHKVIEVRQAVAIDGCEREQFEGLPKPTPAPVKKSSG